MSKHSERAFRSSPALPLLILILLGTIFLGTYIAVLQLGNNRPPLGVAIGFLVAYLLFSALTFLYFALKEKRKLSAQSATESVAARIHNTFKYLVDLPYAIADEDGRVRVINQALQTQLGARDPFFRGSIADICGGVSLPDIVKAAGESAGGAQVRLKTGNRFLARAHTLELEDRLNYLVTFTDITAYLDLKEKTERNMPVVAYLDIDNLEELAQYTRVSYRDVSRRVDDLLLQWANSKNALFLEYERDRYLLVFSQEHLRECEEEKFNTLLDGVRNIRLGEYGISVTVSVGISVADAPMEERAKEAQSALELALQRGGDQVVVRGRDGIRYYGGQTRTFQRRTRVQSRIAASYLLTKISEADNLLIMGHRNPDFDSIGSCLGMAQLGLLAGVRTKIIMDMENDNFKVATQRLLASRTYADMFISGHDGLDLVRPGTLLILTDVNNLDMIESTDIASSIRQISGKIAIIDHHRQTAEYDFEPVFTYIDPSASSASELVTEMLEQSETGTETESLVSDEVATVILSGITLDTRNFVRNTGTRTLDAVRFLYTKGASAEHVHAFFDEDYSDYMRDRSFSGCMLLQNSTVGLTWSHGTGDETSDRVAAAKEADKLLGVKGVSAAFALVKLAEVVHISGRSDGSVNVQLILEHLGGGGRFDSAGAAMQGSSLEEAKEKLIEAVNKFFTEAEGSRHAD